MATESETGRLEAFSDGVFAIAITLLVLDLHVPLADSLKGTTLLRTLGNEWPELFAYAVSFVVIGILWVNHHTMFTAIERVNRRLLFSNLLLLMLVAFLPFPTSLVAEYLRVGGTSSHVAAAVYSTAMLLVGFTYAGVWAAATSKTDRLVPGLDDATAARSRIRFGLGNLVYLATIGLSFVSAPLVLVIHLLIALYYVKDQLAEIPQNSGGSSGSTQTSAQG